MRIVLSRCVSVRSIHTYIHKHTHMFTHTHCMSADANTVGMGEVATDCAVTCFFFLPNLGALLTAFGVTMAAVAMG